MEVQIIAESLTRKGGHGGREVKVVFVSVQTGVVTVGFKMLQTGRKAERATQGLIDHVRIQEKPGFRLAGVPVAEDGGFKPPPDQNILAYSAVQVGSPMEGRSV